MPEELWKKMPSASDSDAPAPPTGTWEMMPRAEPTFSEKAEGMGHGLMTGLVRGGAISLGVLTGGIAGAPGGPVGMAAGGALGGGLGLKLADKWVGHNDLEQYDPGVRPYVVGGEIFGEGIPMAAAPVLSAARGFRAADAGFGRFLNRILDTAARSPAGFVGAELSGLSGASFAGGVAEAYMPGEAGPRTAAEIAGGFFSPTRLLMGPLKGATEAFQRTSRTLTKSGRETNAAKIIQKLVVESGEDPTALAASLRAMGVTDAPMTAAMKSGSSALAALEKTLAGVSGQFRADQAQKFKDATFSIKAAIALLRETGDPNALKQAANLRLQYFKSLINGRLEMAEQEAATAAARITRESPDARMALSKQADELITKAMQDVRAVERELWQSIPKETPAVGDELLETAARLRNEMLPNEVFPPPLQGFLDQLSEKASKATSVGELTLFRSRALALAREYQAKGESTWSWISGNLAEAALETMGKIDSASSEYNAAREFSRELNDVFTRTFAGDALARTRSGGDKIPPELLLERAMAGGASQTSIRMEQLREAVEFLPKRSPDDPVVVGDLNQMIDLQQRMVRIAASESIDPATGRVSAQRLARFVKQNKSTLDAFPELQAELTSALTSEQNLKNVQRTLGGASRVIEQQTAFAKVATKHPVDAVRGALQSGDPLKEMTALTKLAVRGGESAKRGLLASVFDHAIQRVTSSTGEINAKALREALTKPIRSGQPSVMHVLQRDGIITPEQVKSFNSLYDELDRVTAAFAEGVPVEDLISQFDPIFDLATRIAGAKMGQAASQAGPGGGMGSSLIAAGAGSEFSRHLFSKVPATRSRDLLIEASLNPQFAAMLIEKPVPPDLVIQLARQIHAYMMGAGLTPFSEGQIFGDDLSDPGDEQPPATMPSPSSIQMTQ